MRKIHLVLTPQLFFAVCFLFFLNYVNAQCTLTLQPNGATGIDAVISNYPGTLDNNYGNYPEFIANAWTINGTQVIDRSFIRFDLSSIPINSTVQQATLTLYNDPNAADGN